MSNIDNRSKDAEDSARAHRHESEERFNRHSDEFQDAAARQDAVDEKVSRLVQICVGTKIGVEDFRKLTISVHSDTRRQLDRVERRQYETLVTSQAISTNLSSLEAVVKQLLRVFGFFSVGALKLLQSILKTDLEIYALLRQVQNRIPQEPCSAREDTFRFVDALVRTQQLQYQWFKHWDVFESMLKCEFKRLPGESRVLQGDYHILNAKRKDQIISRERWEQSVFPGSEISMSIFITGVFFKQGMCPRPGCGSMNPLDLSEPSLITW